MRRGRLMGQSQNAADGGIVLPQVRASYLARTRLVTRCMHTLRLGDEPRVGNVLTLPAPRTEFVITERMRRGETLTETFRRLAGQLAAGEAVLLSVMIYGSTAAQDEIEAAMRAALGPREWPVTWIDGASCDGLPLAGVQAFAVSGRAVSRVRLGRTIV